MPEAAAPPEVVTLGETMVLLYPPEGETLATASVLHRTIGGAESNAAIALARLGHRVRWISRLGADPFAETIRTTLEGEKVDVQAQVDADALTAVFFKERAQGTGRRVYYYRAGSAASRMGPDDITPELLRGARMLHLTGITPALSELCAAAVDRAIDLARDLGLTVVVDPNVRPQLWPSKAVGGHSMLRLMARADVVLLGHEDAEYVYPHRAPPTVLRSVAALGAATVVVKRGERGAMALQNGEIATIDAVPVTVVDTVGAGDGFDAGFIAGMLRGEPLQRCLELGVQVGAAAVTSAGDWEGYPHAQSPGRINAS
jgi:2-dehydro-3-deoxygluconokinase